MPTDAELPRYRCHKGVWALKIAKFDVVHGVGFITPEEPGYATFEVPPEYVTKHNPQAGGYYVVYDDGYKSWSPAKAFEDGYVLELNAPPPPAEEPAKAPDPANPIAAVSADPAAPPLEV